MNRAIRRFTRTTLFVALGFVTLPSLSQGLRGQELPWLPGGTVRLDFAPTFWNWDSRYGIAATGTDEVELLGLDLTGDPLGSALLPDLRELEQSLGLALDDSSYRVQLGVSRAYMGQSRLVFPFRLEMGITDWLTVGAMAPLVRPRTELTFTLDADALSATDGVSPFVSDPSSVLSFLNAFGVGIDGARAVHGEAQAVTDAQAYLDALDEAYRDETFFPLSDSSPGVMLQERFDALKTALLDLGATGLPSSVPLAQTFLNEEEFQAFLGGSQMQAFPLEDWTTQWSLGDVELSANVMLLRSGFQVDSLGAVPRFRFQVGGGALVRLGMGTQEDPARFFDQDIGDGQMDLEGTVFGMVEYGSRLGAWGQMRYGVQMEGDVIRRITDPSETLPNSSRTAPLRWTPGDYLEIDLNPRVFLTPEMSFGVRYHLWSKAADHYTLGELGLEFPDAGLLPSAELLDLETEQDLHELGFSATYSTVAAHGRGEASMPLHLRATYFRPVSGRGGQTPKGGRFQAGLTIYKTFWGGPEG